MVEGRLEDLETLVGWVVVRGRIGSILGMWVAGALGVDLGIGKRLEVVPSVDWGTLEA